MTGNFPRWKASELIKALQQLMKVHGDQPVYSSGGDYPEPVEGVYVKQTGDGYIPEGAFVI